MSNLTRSDIDLLYWHANNKMRAGQFESAATFFTYLQAITPSFHHGLGAAYCALRAGQIHTAKALLETITASDVPEQKLHARLVARVAL
jgi:thioredoxin-like negative regulator of GroEL